MGIVVAVPHSNSEQTHSPMTAYAVAISPSLNQREEQDILMSLDYNHIGCLPFEGY